MRLLTITILLAASLMGQYTPPSGGGGGGSPSGSADAIQTYATSSTFGNAGFATSGGQVALADATPADGALFAYSKTISDATPFGGSLFSLFWTEYSGSVAIDAMNGYEVDVTNSGGADVTELYGLTISPDSTGGTVISMYGLETSLDVSGGTVTNAYGVYIDSPSISGGGAVTNNFGLGINDQPGDAIHTGTGKVSLGDRTNAPAFMASGTTFTASGCGNGTLVGGATAGKFTSGDAGGSCSIVITMGASMAATTGWSCHVQDLSAPAKVWGQTASDATTATFLSPGVTTSTNVVSFFCVGY